MPPLWPPPRTRTGDWQDPAQIRARLSRPIPALGLKPVQKPCDQVCTAICHLYP